MLKTCRKNESFRQFSISSFLFYNLQLLPLRPEKNDSNKNSELQINRGKSNKIEIKEKRRATFHIFP